ncbi:MAG TPA: 3-hydroxybutyryl-CoA dehydrogenase [Candidatus Acidoferrales bacterium]
MEIQKVGVVGCGLMGSGIAHIAAAAGYPVVVREVSQELIDKGLKAIEKNLQRQVDKGILSAEAKAAALGRLKGTTQLSDVAGCDLIIEAVTENFDVKKSIYQELDQLCGPNAVFASNTSSLCITAMAATTKRPGRFLGLHFFNPVPVMKLVEVIRTIATESEVLEAVIQFAHRLGKTPVRTSDRTGFIVNRLLVPYLLDAVRALEEGVGTIEDIDNAMKLGCGYPMGPFTLLDFVGLDTTMYIADIMFDEFKEKRFSAPSLLRRLVLAGWAGRKTGKGFYDYSNPEKPIPSKGLEARG